MKRLDRVGLVAVAALLVFSTHAAGAEPPDGKVSEPASKVDDEVLEADAELLEFLGSIDTDDEEGWLDYLARTDISKAAKARKQRADAAEVKK